MGALQGHSECTPVTLSATQKKHEDEKKSTDEEQRETMHRGKIAEVLKIGERGSEKEGTARLHSCPRKEQMSLFFSFPLMLLSPHPRERGRGGGRRQGRLGGGT